MFTKFGQNTNARNMTNDIKNSSFSTANNGGTNGIKDRHKTRNETEIHEILPHHVNSHHKTSQPSHSSLLLWMLIDGIGLAIIAGATFLEGVKLWNDFFNAFWETNSMSIGLWFSGRTCQLIGLFFLIGHAASFQIFHFVEQFGMFWLTVGPALNLTACYLFNSGNDPSFLFNKQWFSNETLEIVGIFVLDISMIDMHEFYVLIAEVVGFFLLCLAAILDFEYDDANIWCPKIECRLDMVHTSECFGLIILTIVAIGQYRMKVIKHSNTHAHSSNSVTSNHGNVHHNSHGSHNSSNSHSGNSSNSSHESSACNNGHHHSPHGSPHKPTHKTHRNVHTHSPRNSAKPATAAADEEQGELEEDM